MRINIYAEELPAIPVPSVAGPSVNLPAVEVVVKSVNQELFYGVRLFLRSPKELHYGTSDDDRSAITIWVPWTKKDGHKPETVLKLLRLMHDTLEAEAIGRGDIGEFTHG